MAAFHIEMNRMKTKESNEKSIDRVREFMSVRACVYTALLSYVLGRVSFYELN